jgi:hypothetical protein
MISKMKKTLTGLSIIIVFIMTFLVVSCPTSTQSSYIEIKDVSPKTGLTEETTDITVSIEYFVSSQDTNMITIGFNTTDDSLLLIPVDDFYVNAPTHGEYQKTYSVLPKQHSGREFHVTAFISDISYNNVADIKHQELTF